MGSIFTQVAVNNHWTLLRHLSADLSQLTETARCSLEKRAEFSHRGFSPARNLPSVYSQNKTLKKKKNSTGELLETENKMDGAG